MKSKFRIPMMLSLLVLLGASGETPRRVIVGEPKEVIEHALYVKVLDPARVELKSIKWR